MRPILIDKKAVLLDSISVKEVKLPYLDSPYHFHNAYEMVLIVKGDGKRIIGDHIDHFTDGDLVLLGPKLPHVWYTDNKYHDNPQPDAIESLVVYFHPDWLSNNLWESPELSKLTMLLSNLERGVVVNGSVKKKIVKRIKRIKNEDGLKKVIYLLSILEMLSTSQEYECLASMNFSNSFTQKNVERIEKVYQYVMLNYAQPIKLDEVAEIANMTPTAFCKYFKTHTQKTFSSFLNEFRIGHACKLLHNDNLTISQIYYDCGYNNFSNFNRCFKQFKNMSPSEFRSQIS